MEGQQHNNPLNPRCSFTHDQHHKTDAAKRTEGLPSMEIVASETHV